VRIARIARKHGTFSADLLQAPVVSFRRAAKTRECKLRSPDNPLASRFLSFIPALAHRSSSRLFFLFQPANGNTRRLLAEEEEEGREGENARCSRTLARPCAVFFLALKKDRERRFGLCRESTSRNDKNARSPEKGESSG